MQGVVNLGQAIGFADTNSDSVHYLAFVHPCEQVHAAAKPYWRTNVGEIVAVDARVLDGCVMYALVPGGFVPYIKKLR